MDARHFRFNRHLGDRHNGLRLVWINMTIITGHGVIYGSKYLPIGIEIDQLGIDVRKYIGGSPLGGRIRLKSYHT
jgi:hypothetical protein